MSNSHVPRRLICATYTWSALLRSREHVFRPAKTLQRYPPPLSPSIAQIYRLTYDRFSRAFRITIAIFVQPRWEMIIFFFFFSFSLSKLNAATETEWKSIDQSREKKGRDDSRKDTRDSPRQKCDHRRENHRRGWWWAAESSFRPWESVFISFPLSRCRNLPNASFLAPSGPTLLLSSSPFPPLFARARENKLW